MEQEAERDLLLTCISHLSEQEQLIMNLRFGIGGNQEHTQKEVADLLGISQSYISRLEKDYQAAEKRPGTFLLNTMDSL